MRYTKSLTSSFIVFLIIFHLMACATMTSLTKAAKDGDINKLNALISSDNINERDPKWGWTPLHYAAYYNQIDAVKFLIEKGANVHIADEQGDTPLLLAAMVDNKDTINVLVDSGADINIPNRNGSTPLIVAIQAGQIEIARMLIEKGADVDVVDSYGHRASDYVYHLQQPLIKRIFKAEDKKALESFLKLLKDTEAEQVPTKDTEVEQVPIFAHKPMQPECTQIPLQVVPPEERTRTMKIAILPARFLPETDAINFTMMSKVASSALSGTAAGAGAGVFVTAGTPAAIFLMPIGAGVGLVVGTVVGVVSGDTKEEALEKKKVLEMENETKRVLLELKIQETMARYVQAAGKRETDRDFIVVKDAGPSSPGDKPDYTALVKQGIDTVLEIAVKKIGSAKIGGTGRDAYYFYMIVQAKLVHGTESSTQEFKYIIGPPRHYSEWIKAGADALQKEVEKAYEALAEDIVEFAFLYAYFESMDSPLFVGSPLQILIPKILNTRYILGSLSGFALEYPYASKTIDTLQPTFKWESFPTAQDIRVDRKGIVNRISNVTYDLRVWRDNESERVLIYEKKGLKDNNHKIECSLEHHSYYLWTVRARFRLDDQYKATRWATLPRLFSIYPGYGIDLFAGSMPVGRRSYYPFLTRAE